MFSRLRRLFRLASGRPNLETELAEELELHLSLRTDELIAEGIPAAEARRRAEQSFGNRAQIESRLSREARRDRSRRRRGEILGGWTRDLRLGARALARDRVYAIGGVSIVAIAIAANTAIFTAINAAFLKPFPYPDSDRIAYVWEVGRSRHPVSVSRPNADDWIRENPVFGRLAFFSDWPVALSGDGGPAEYVRAAFVSRDFPAVLGVDPIRGRWFGADENRLGGPPVVVVSERLWRRRYGADSGLVGRTIRVEGASAQVIGIAPAAFQLPLDTDLWSTAERFEDNSGRSAHNYRVIGRLKSGVSIAAAAQAMDRLTQRIVAGEAESEYLAVGATVIPLRDELVGSHTVLLVLLQVSVLLVLGIAAVNLANLTLARVTRRWHETATRLALGASRAAIVRGFWAETLMLTLTGAVVGLALARPVRDFLRILTGSLTPLMSELPIDGRVQLFAVGLAIAVALLTTIVASARLGRIQATAGLASQGRSGGASPRSARVMGWLVTAEVALALVLLAGAGLLVRSLIALNRIEPGFENQNRLVIDIPLTVGESSVTPTPELQIAAYDRLLSTIAGAPGVEAVGATSAVPLRDGGPDGGSEVDGITNVGGPEVFAADFFLVSPGYFGAAGIPMRSGREFAFTDAPGAQYVAIVNQAYQNRYLQGASAIGRRVKLSGMEGFDDQWATVVGVVSDIHQRQLYRPAEPAIYYSYRQRAPRWRRLSLVVHTANPSAVTVLARDELARLDPGLPFASASLTSVTAEAMAIPRARSLLLGAFAVAGLLLAAVGIFAVVAFAVTQRTREIGVRMALGADRRRIVLNTVASGLRPVLSGLVVGLVGVGLGAGSVRSLLFAVAPLDPVALSLSVAALLGTAAIACYLPARRASRVEPIRTLRVE